MEEEEEEEECTSPPLKRPCTCVAMDELDKCPFCLNILCASAVCNKNTACCKGGICASCAAQYLCKGRAKCPLCAKPWVGTQTLPLARQRTMDNKCVKCPECQELLPLAQFSSHACVPCCSPDPCSLLFSSKEEEKEHLCCNMRCVFCARAHFVDECKLWEGPLLDLSAEFHQAFRERESLHQRTRELWKKLFVATGCLKGNQQKPMDALVRFFREHSDNNNDQQGSAKNAKLVFDAAQSLRLLRPKIPARAQRVLISLARALCRPLSRVFNSLGVENRNTMCSKQEAVDMLKLFVKTDFPLFEEEIVLQEALVQIGDDCAILSNTFSASQDQSVRSFQALLCWKRIITLFGAGGFEAVYSSSFFREAYRYPLYSGESPSAAILQACLECMRGLSRQPVREAIQVLQSARPPKNSSLNRLMCECLARGKSNLEGRAPPIVDLT